MLDLYCVFVLDLHRTICARLLLCVRGRLVVCAWLVPECLCSTCARLILSVLSLYQVFVLGLYRVCVCRDKTGLLSREKYACRDEIVMIKLLSRKDVLPRQSMVVATKVCHKIFLSRQKFCHEKYNFVAPNVILRGQKFCRDKNIL